MLVLGIETTSPRGSVALLDDGQTLAEAAHSEPNAHGERILGLIDQVFERAQRSKAQLDRVAVGRGPGTFTGLRIGLALAQGIASGLTIPAIGIGSLRAMAAGMPRDLAGPRWTLLDARRGELFLACYGADGAELWGPRTIAKGRLVEELCRLSAGLAPTAGTSWLLGDVVASLPELVDPNAVETLEKCGGFRRYGSTHTDWPHATSVARIASNPEESTPATPEYLRDADAVMPNLPASPLSRPRTD